MSGLSRNEPPFTVPQFAELSNVSRATIYKAWQAGTGPEHVKLGRRTLIVERPTDWLLRVAQRG